jgi:hypothetical protein
MQVTALCIARAGTITVGATIASYDGYQGAVPSYRDADILAAFMRGVYGWMCGGLLIHGHGVAGLELPTIDGGRTHGFDGEAVKSAS